MGHKKTVQQWAVFLCYTIVTVFSETFFRMTLLVNLFGLLAYYVCGAEGK